MPGSKGPSRTTSKDSDKLKLNSNRTNSSRTDASSARSQGSNSKLRQKLITTSMTKQEDGSKTSSTNSTSESKDLKKGQSSSNQTNKLDNRNHKNAKDGKSPFDSSNKNLKQTTLTKSGSVESNKRSLTKSISSSYDNEDSDYESETPKNKNKSFKMNSTNSSCKSTPSKLSAKKSSDDKDKTKNTTPTSKDNASTKDVVTLNGDEDVEVNSLNNKIANSNEFPKSHNLNHTLVNSSNVDNLCSNFNEEDADKMNDEFRFKRSKRSHYKLQDSILGLIAKYQSDLEHLDDKIKTLEAQFFTNPAETIGLVKGWEGNVLNNAYTNISNGLKSRRALNAKLKANFTQTQNLITEHIFSLTSSTCAVSKMLLNN